MRHQDYKDLRSRGAGGWCYSENILYDFFSPLIESDGTQVYGALTRLVPRAAVDPDRPASLRAIEDASCVSKSQVDRKLEELVALGMVLRKTYGPKQSASYQLPQLTELAQVGRDELLKRLLTVVEAKEIVRRLRKRDPEVTPGKQFNPSAIIPTLLRLAVPPWDSESIKVAEMMAREARLEDPSSRAQSGDADDSDVDPAANSGEAPAASGDGTVPPRDSEGGAPELTVGADPLSHGDVDLSRGKADLSHQSGHLSHGGDRVNRKEEEEEVEEIKDNTPPTPPDGGAHGDPGDQALWGEFKTLLKSELSSIPANLAAAKRFGEIKHGENDYDAAFRDWWLIEARGITGGIALLTGVTDAASTHAGIVKYEKRLAGIVRKYWKLPAAAKVSFVIQKGQTR